LAGSRPLEHLLPAELKHPLPVALVVNPPELKPLLLAELEHLLPVAPAVNPLELEHLLPAERAPEPALAEVLVLLLHQLYRPLMGRLLVTTLTGTFKTHLPTRELTVVVRSMALPWPPRPVRLTGHRPKTTYLILTERATGLLLLVAETVFHPLVVGTVFHPLVVGHLLERT
jgi:hypothetical protein